MQAAGRDGCQGKALRASPAHKERLSNAIDINES
jgi:hypothetical protein